MDEIRIDNLEVYAYHGVYSEERRQGQTFYVNTVLLLDTRLAGITDDLSCTVDYGKVCHFIADWMKRNTCNLIESAAEKLAETLLLNFDLIHSVRMEVRKPEAPVGLPFESVSVCIERGWHQAFLSLGSNMGDREAYLLQGITALKEDARIRVHQISENLVTKPYGGVEQEDFLNAALEVETLYTPRELLDKIHRVEAQAGRRRELHWGPRTLDMDILFYDKLVCGEEELAIPHVDLENRYFVLKPLSEIAPYHRHPITGKTVLQMLAELPDLSNFADEP